MNRFWLGLACLLLAPLFLFSLVRENVSVYLVENGNQYDVYADNFNHCPMQVLVRFRSPAVRPNTDLPYYAVISAREKGRYLFSIFNRFVTEKDLKLDFETTIGDPNAVIENPDYPYVFPFEEGTQRRVSQGYNGRYSHRGWQRYSLDFGMPIGTPVCAVRDGMIVDVKQDSGKSGRARRYSQHANYITLSHGDGTYSQYVHLDKFGSLVEVGTKVTQGQVIGLSGNTGRSKGPHLHFMVFIPVYMKRQTIPTKFTDRFGNLFEAKSKRYYVSQRLNPGVPVASAPLVSTNANLGTPNGIRTDETGNLGGF